MSNQMVETDKHLEDVLNSHKTIIRIVGAGGGGNNTVSRLLEVGISGVEVIAVNTDAQDLLFAKADHKLLIGRSITNGLGAGSEPKKGEEAAIENIIEIEQVLNGSDMVFVTCGLGGGTGTGSAPIIAEVAKKSGALTIAIVTLPFSDEGIVRWENARQGLERLQDKVDTVIVVQNDRLMDLVPDMSLNAAFKVADEILVNAVKGITELVTEKGLVNLDFADVRTIMQNGGLAMIGIGESDSEKNAEEAALNALQNPLLDVEITGAKNALINITGGQDLSLKSSKIIMKTIAERLDPSAKIIWGARLDESMQQSLRVMLIVTYLKSNRKSVSEIDMAIKQTKIATTKAEEPKKQKQTQEIPGKEKIIAEPVPSEVKTIKKNGNKVFSEIFMDESRADITVLKNAIKGLAIGNRSSNEKCLREIKNACSSLYNSSELFAFGKISEYAELIGEVTERALNGEFDLSENLLDLYKKLPSALNSMIIDENGANGNCDEIKHQLMSILDLFKMPANNDKKLPEKDNINENIILEKNDITEKSTDNDDVKILREENDKTGDLSEITEKSEDEDEDNGKPKFTSVKDAVKFIDKLL